MNYVHVPANRRIFDQGEFGETFFLLLDGVADVVKAVKHGSPHNESQVRESVETVNLEVDLRRNRRLQRKFTKDCLTLKEKLSDKQAVQQEQGE
jgi:hypothetical protein